MPEIVVKDLEGNVNTVIVDDKATGADLKRAIATSRGGQVAVETVSYMAVPIQDDQQLCQLGMKDGAVVMVTIAIIGGI